MHETAAVMLWHNTPMPACSDRETGRQIQVYVDNVRRYAEGNTLLVEQEINLEPITGEQGAVGTADVIIITTDGKELQVHDLKTGFNEVVVENNEQLSIYALGALQQYEAFGDFERVRLVIHQVAHSDKPKEWVTSVEQLNIFGEHVKTQASIALNPADERNVAITGDKQCSFCRAAGVCPALNNSVSEVVGEVEFPDLNENKINTATRMAKVWDAEKLSYLYSMVPLVELWCLAVKARVEETLLRGEPIPGYKLVEGKRGNRQWVDETSVETLFKKTYRLKNEDMYVSKLISPTAAETLLGADQRRWAKVEKLIVRKDGKPIVAPEHDRRPALVVGEGVTFEPLENQGE